MNTGSFGDLAQGYLMRTRHSEIKNDIQRLTEELTTGQVSDVRGTLAGNYSFLTDVERKSELLGSYAVATSEAIHFTAATQQALGNFGMIAQSLSASLLSAGTSASGADAADIAAESRAALDAMVGTLNSNFAGRTMFAGNATNQAPVVNASTWLADLSAAIAGATNPEKMVALADAWFDAPGGFAASAYLGSDDALSSFVLSAEQSVSLDVRATETALTDPLRAAALAALATDPNFGLTAQAQSELFSLTGQDMLVSQDGVTALQSRVGLAEARIDSIASRNAAEQTSLNMARTALLQADPFETATQLEEVQFQLQSLYSVTVRMSQLSLVNFL